MADVCVYFFLFSFSSSSSSYEYYVYLDFTCISKSLAISGIPDYTVTSPASQKTRSHIPYVPSLHAGKGALLAGCTARAACIL